MLWKEARTKNIDTFCVGDKVGVFIIDCIPTVILKMFLEKVKNQEMWLRFFIEDQVGVSVIDSIPHCHTENVLKRGKNHEMGFVSIKRKNGVSIIDSIPHCLTEVL